MDSIETAVLLRKSEQAGRVEEVIHLMLRSSEPQAGDAERLTELFEEFGLDEGAVGGILGLVRDVRATERASDRAEKELARLRDKKLPEIDPVALAKARELIAREERQRLESERISKASLQHETLVGSLALDRERLLSQVRKRVTERLGP